MMTVRFSEMLLEIMKENRYLVLQVPYGNPDKGPIYQDLVNRHVREGYSIDDICKKVKDAGSKIVSTGGSVGKIGQFAYRFGMQLLKFRFVIHIGLVLFPLISFLV
jgi:hypothetical protein